MNEIKKIKKLFYNLDYNKDNKEMNNKEMNLTDDEIIKLKQMILLFEPKKEKEPKPKKEVKQKKEVKHIKHIIVEPKSKREPKPKKEPKIKIINRDENNKPLKFTCGCGGIYTHLSKWCHTQSQKHKHFEESGEILKKTCFNFTKKDLSPEEHEKRKAWYREYTKTHKFPKKKSEVCKDLIKNLVPIVEEDDILKNIINLIDKDKGEDKGEDKPSHSI